VLSACGDLTRIAVTCACILTSQRSTMARAFGFIADANALLPRAWSEDHTHPQFRYYV
jgi:hypothetical protein